MSFYVTILQYHDRRKIGQLFVKVPVRRGTFASNQSETEKVYE